MKRALFLLLLLPSIAYADRLGSLKSNADVALTTQTSSGGAVNPSTGPWTFPYEVSVTTNLRVSGQIFTGSDLVTDFPHIVFPATTDSAIGFYGSGNQIDIVDHGQANISFNPGTDGGIGLAMQNGGFSTTLMSFGRNSPTEAVTGIFGVSDGDQVGVAVGSVKVASFTAHAMSVSDENSSFDIYLGTLPVNSGFGPQVVTGGIWNQTNNSGDTLGSFNLVVSTTPRRVTAGGAPIIPAKGASLSFTSSGVSYSTYNYDGSLGALQFSYGDTGLTVNNAVTATNFIGDGSALTGIVPEAPVDGTAYVRKDAAWINPPLVSGERIILEEDSSYLLGE